MLRKENALSQEAKKFLSSLASPSARDVAVLPIHVQQPLLPLVLPPPEVHFWSCQKTVPSQRLLPGRELSRLFLADRLSCSISAPGIPHYTFRLTLPVHARCSSTRYH